MNDFTANASVPHSTDGSGPAIIAVTPGESTLPALGSRSAIPAASWAATPPPAARRYDGPPRGEPRTITPPATPVLSYALALNTDFAQRVFRRTWERLKPDLYVLTVRTRASRQHEAAKAIEAIITDAFAKTRRDLAADLERTEVLIDHVKVTDFPKYKQTLNTDATYSTPRAKEFLLLLQQMDQLLIRYDALWLNGHIETHIRVDRSQNWQRRMIKICNRLRELAQTTRARLARPPQLNAPSAATALPGGGAAGTAPDEDHVLGQIPPEHGDGESSVDDPELDELVSGEGAAAEELVGVAELDAAFAADAQELDAQPPADALASAPVGSQSEAAAGHPTSGEAAGDASPAAEGEGGPESTVRRRRRSPAATPV
jgi:hypothetical protein